jgi:hypothetical protein
MNAVLTATVAGKRILSDAFHVNPYLTYQTQRELLSRQKPTLLALVDELI